jgi:hypothetical protein
MVMTEIPDTNNHDYYPHDARRAILAAVPKQHDFGGWLAALLANAAADLGSTRALTAALPSSWEADLVQQLVNGSVGWDDYLADYRSPS